MKHITMTMNNLNLEQDVDSEHISILENILRETRNPKIAAVLALDLMLVGVDTVSFFFFALILLIKQNFAIEHLCIFNKSRLKQ